MNLGQVVALLKVALVLLASSANAAPADRQQAFTFANEAINIANEAMLNIPATTTLQDTVTTSTALVVPEFAAPAASVDVGGGSVAAATSTQMAAKQISVSFETKQDDGFVTVKNDTGVAVRVKGLNVPNGAVAGVTIGPVYGNGFVYPDSLIDSTGTKFELFACSGAGSEGTAILAGGNIDPCMRRDGSGLLRNELEPGEAMVIRYVKTGTEPVSAPVYQQGSIVEVATGNDVTF